MNINTKFNVKDKVFILINNSIVERTIGSIEIHVSSTVVVSYKIQGITYTSNSLFFSREAVASNWLKQQNVKLQVK